MEVTQKKFSALVYCHAASDYLEVWANVVIKQERESNYVEITEINNFNVEDNWILNGVELQDFKNAVLDQYFCYRD